MIIRAETGKNTAFLYSGNKLVNQANATVSCPNTILLKDALTAVDGAKDLTNADNVNKQASADKLYNYKDGSATPSGQCKRFEGYDQ